jgi:ubiquinone/menaquinone biosynthesis C-methylase UbiE
MQTKVTSKNASGPSPEAIENHRKMSEREALFGKFGFDMDAEFRHVLDCARPLTGNILEIGTGKGRFLMSLARENVRITTVDNDKEAVACARLNAEFHGLFDGIEWTLHNAESLPWPDHTFNAVVSMNALHHMTQVWTVLAEAHRVLKPGGKLVLADFTQEGFDLMDRVHQSEGGTHPRGTGNAAEFRTWLEQHGYRVTLKESRLVFVLVAQR